MEYEIKKLRDADGNLRDEIDPIRGRYSFSPFEPTGASDEYITIPSDKVFYMDIIEVENTDGSNSHTFVVQDSSGNDLSITYTVDAGKTATIQFYHGGLTGEIHFKPDAYSTLKFKPSGYMSSVD